ncbi:MAG: hypothetical protein H7343_20615 [Undibacterium sp.]|nr:hypothetical protein [Opitutaceae bacterium]
MRCILLLFALLAAATSVIAQLTNAGRFFGTVPGSGEIHIKAPTADKAYVYVFDRTQRVMEFAVMSVSLFGQGGARSSVGLRINVGLGCNSVTGAVGGIVFTTPRQATISSYQLRQYSGIIFDDLGRVGIARLVVLPSGCCK